MGEKKSLQLYYIKFSKKEMLFNENKVQFHKSGNEREKTDRPFYWQIGANFRVITSITQLRSQATLLKIDNKSKE